MAPAERLLKDRLHARFSMVANQLRPHGIRNARLLQAFESVPREAFAPTALQALAYADVDLPLTAEPLSKRWLLAPLTLARLLQLADIQPADKVLVIGCGSGYSLALLAHLAAHVVGLEHHIGLAQVASAYGADQGFSTVQVVRGVLTGGYPKGGPYDVMILEGAVARISPVVLQQLTPQGRLVTIVKENQGWGQGVVVSRTGDALTQTARFEANCPYLPGFEPKEEFRL